MKNNYLTYIALAFLFISCSEERVFDSAIDQEINMEELELFYQDILNEPSQKESFQNVKRNPKKLYVHYMPWFHSKEVDGYWGQHWTMTNKNPDNIDVSGKREIASHYYPKIGPYSSNDTDLQKYHLLLMKLSGIDGVIFDWYGSRDIHDYKSIKDNTESFIEEIEEVGLEFAIMYEDRVAEYASDENNEVQQRVVSGIDAVTLDMQYIQSTYFTSDNYIRLNGREMLFTFGPHFITNPSDWESVFTNSDMKPDVYTLWKASDRVGKCAGGEFSWIDKGHTETLRGYYDYVRENNITAVGGAYGGFNHYYTEGGWSDSTYNNWTIPHNHTDTFKETLRMMDNEPVAFIQLLTWNDFGEGTMLEPTEEFGFDYLKEIQTYSGSVFKEHHLELPYRLYQLKKKYGNNKRLNRILDGLYKFIFTLELKKARRLLKKIRKYYPL
ncbi:glycoside hydrolase family 71/99-like protein [Tenacibaculum geojense]|uniref:Glycoside hydrolase family 71/99-like protein n=1 Tax=Tenacibaculum geojense TaxID=915352 RepID=A0ABW3JVA6_9FLAO